MAVKVEKVGSIVVLALLLIGAGLTLPSQVTQERSYCPNPDPTCDSWEEVTVEEEVQNPWKAPLIVGGGILLVFVLVYGGDTSLQLSEEVE